MLKEAEDALKDFQPENIKWMMEIMQQKWLQTDGNVSTRIYASFKQDAIRKGIHQLKDEEGNIKTQWEELVAITHIHFVSLLGTPLTLSKIDLEEVL